MIDPRHRYRTVRRSTAFLLYLIVAVPTLMALFLLTDRTILLVRSVWETLVP
ncbi:MULTISPECIES: hypothetical protein [Nocardiopsis]|jgi:hypothetical protein|uniref:Uncharacterized protein n=2 Tax=Nocardiopsis alba TaxID=53437 RepID=A0ABV5DTE6_9ACTN|nr:MULTISPECIES: hypothetical protein [Nocardiopsis]AFR10642.1 hypothetical protein B005_3438 [Nocardiopsis alba ATCC BAA-2165]MEC3894359.1 hypothetical protein [Nocardiopsis sp. LDBS1602]